MRNFSGAVIILEQSFGRQDKTLSVMYSKQMYRFWPHSRLELGDASDQNGFCRDDEQIDSKILP